MKPRCYVVLFILVLFAGVHPLASLGETVAASSQFGLPGDIVIQFPDPNFEEEVRWLLGKPIGDITANDVTGITSLLLGTLGITDLTGIEYFTALEVLDCGENLLTELDISQNTMLTVLKCNMNSLTTLDVSHNTMLTRLICWENQLTTLDVSHNPALDYLTCDTNQLMTLDVSHNPVLEQLRCGSNQLTTLNVSHNPALEWLSCDDNQLTTLDVSQNPALESLNCQNNLLPSRSAIIGLDESRLKHFVFDPQGDL